MSQAANALDEEVIASPCIDICKMDPATGLCAGCRRTIDEIASWSTLSAAEKRAVLVLLSARKPTP
jgi:uncharacterized protein